MDTIKPTMPDAERTAGSLHRDCSPAGPKAGRRVLHLWMGRGNVIDERPGSIYATVVFDVSDYPSDVRKEHLIPVQENSVYTKTD